MSKKAWIIMMAILIVFSVCNTLSAQDKAKVVVKLATLLPKSSAGRFIELQKAVKEQTNNEVQFKIYYGGIQGDEHDVIRKIRYRQLDGGSFTGHGLGQIVSAVRITELPYLFKNYGEVTYVRTNLEETMNQMFRKEGYVVLCWYETGFAYVFSKVPITSLEVARKQKWWMWDGDPMQKANFDAMDIAPVSLTLTEVLTSLSTRLIDAAATTPFGAIAFRWYTRFQYMGEYPIANGIVGIIVTKNAWDKISAASQQKIMAISNDIFSGMVQERRDSNAQSITVLKKNGITIVPYDMESEDMKFIVSCSQKAREAMIGKLYSKELFDRTLALLAEYRKNNPDSTVVKIE